MPSKSARKREHLELQRIGEQLITLTDTQLAVIPLDDPLREAVLLAQRIKSHGAQRRQRQLIGKLMRQADIVRIREALEAIARRHRADTRLLHEAEQWRERLIQEGPVALGDFSALTGSPNAELEQLLEALPKVPKVAMARRLRREIFRQIHTVLSAETDNGMQKCTR